MRKSVVLLGASLLLLTACGQKSGQNQSGDSKTGSSVVKKDSVVTKSFQQKQTVQGIEQILPMKEELKKVVAEVGVAEAQKLLEKSLAEDEKFTQAKSLEGFSTSLEIINDQELKRVHTFDFQVLDVNKAADTEYLKNMKLKEFLKMKPKEYVEDQIASGATEVNQ